MAVRKLSSPPTTTITLRPDHWAQSYEKRPRYDLACGLRRLSARDVETAERVAAHAVVDTPIDGIVERYNNKLMAFAVALAHCDPNDTSRPLAELGMRGDDEIEERLTPETVRWLYDRLEDLHAEGPLTPPATDDNVAELASLLASPTRADIDVDTRRLLGRALRALRVSRD